MSAICLLVRVKRTSAIRVCVCGDRRRDIGLAMAAATLSARRAMRPARMGQRALFYRQDRAHIGVAVDYD